MKKYTNNKYIIATAVWIVVCFLLFLVPGHGGNSPKGTVKKLEQAINSGNEKKILNCFNSDMSMAYKLERSFDKNASLLDTLGYEKSKVKILVESVEMLTDSEAEVNCIEIITKKGAKDETVSRDVINMEKENGKWVIQY